MHLHAFGRQRSVTRGWHLVPADREAVQRCAKDRVPRNVIRKSNIRNDLGKAQFAKETPSTVR